MKYLRDPLGRPIPRIFFEDLNELDTACEAIIGDFTQRRYGRFRLPIPTDALINLIAEETDELDLYSQLPDGVEGLTDFYSDRRPRVRIADDLSNARRVHRLRTTLAHEYGHVRFHAPLWRKVGALEQQRVQAPSWTCAWNTIVDAPENDWMEWQAGYVCGALLMPRSEIREFAHLYAMARGLAMPLGANSAESVELIGFAGQKFEVSRLAARIRMLKLRLLVD
ncbi:MAG: ImmA/IrrE family metallo-endopeptidase [Candidatus Binataceae bacterium]